MSVHNGKKRIVFVIPSLHAGGMERVMSELIAYLCSRTQHELHLILYGRNREMFYNLPQGVIVHKPSFRFDDRLRTWSSLRTMIFLRRKVKQIHPHVVLSFGELWNNFVLLALYGTKIPIVVSDRSSPAKRLSFVHDKLRKILYPSATKIIVQTHKAKEIYARFLPEYKLVVLPNPIRYIAHTQDSPHEREKIILNVSRLIHTKHHDRLIRLFARLNAPEWKLVIVGGDAQKQNNLHRLVNLARQLNIESRVLFLGYDKNVDQWYQRSSIFAFTSSSEGFPNVVGEAMSAGLPVVSYDCVAGPSDMITDQVNGFLVPVFDDELFFERLQKLVDDKELRSKLGLAARESIRQFSIDKVGAHYLSILIQ